jgi:cytochrome c55X
MPRLARLLCVALALPAVSALAAPPAGAAGDAPRPEALRRLVLQDCGSCHGMTLKGGLGPDIRPQALAHLDREAVRAIVLDGVPGTAMPPWRPLLSEVEADWIADFLKTGELP